MLTFLKDGSGGNCTGKLSLSIQFRMVSMRSKKPVCAPGRLSEVFPKVAFETVHYQRATQNYVTKLTSFGSGIKTRCDKVICC